MTHLLKVSQSDHVPPGSVRWFHQSCSAQPQVRTRDFACLPVVDHDPVYLTTRVENPLASRARSGATKAEMLPPCEKHEGGLPSHEDFTHSMNASHHPPCPFASSNVPKLSGGNGEAGDVRCSAMLGGAQIWRPGTDSRHVAARSRSFPTRGHLSPLSSVSMITPRSRLLRPVRRARVLRATRSRLTSQSSAAAAAKPATSAAARC